MDPIDYAQQREEQHRDLALAAQANRAKDKPLVIDDEVCCCSCEEPIPEKRLEAEPEAARCLDCQQAHELSKSQGGRR